MIYLILAVLSSALVSVIMRFSTYKVKNNYGMLALNYIMCFTLSVMFAGVTNFFPEDEKLSLTIWLGAFNGVLYLLGFVFLQASTKRNGVVLSSVFMKLGLLVPIAISIIIFKESPTLVQAVGFALAILSIIVINYNKESSKLGSTWLLFPLLLFCGGADAMSKVCERLGSPALSENFLLYTFLTALILCVILAAANKQKLCFNDVFFGLLIGVPNFFAAKFLLMSLSSLPAIVCYPTFCVAALMLVSASGVVLFKEKLKKHQWAALLCILISLALLNI